jgi:hypothetical protein
MPQARLRKTRPRKAWTGSLRAAACALLGAVLLVAHAGHAFAQDINDDDDDLTFEQKIIRNIMGGFGAGGTGAGIDYHERSPLVIPPSRDLPSPQADSSKPAPNWPTDADKRRKVVKKQRKPMDARETKLWDDPGRPLTPSELEIGRTVGPSPNTVTRPGESASQTEGGNPVLPNVLGYTGGVFTTLWNRGKPETAPFTGEPPRTNLTEPPTGYMTPSPNQPYGVGMEANKPVVPKPADLPARANY